VVAVDGGHSCLLAQVPQVKVYERGDGSRERAVSQTAHVVSAEDQKRARVCEVLVNLWQLTVDDPWGMQCSDVTRTCSENGRL
jgi:hypothetical protein